MSVAFAYARRAAVALAEAGRQTRSSLVEGGQAEGAVKLPKIRQPPHTSTILPVTPPLPSNSCAHLASASGNRWAMSGVIF
jgi:hypothetical protein